MTQTTDRPLALVTGASTGIGRELAREFAAHGYDLVVAANEPRIHEAGEELRGAVEVDTVEVDLATDEGVDELWRRVQEHGRPLEAAAINAGIAAGGPFAASDLDRELEMVDLNVRSTVHLAKHVLRDMTARGSGRILFTSSIASTMPGTFQAVYNASKSFIQSFALALRTEAKGTGVTITALMPGPTDTEIFARAGLLDTKIGAGEKDRAADVAHDGFEALMHGDERVVSHSRKTRAQAALSRVLPDSVKAELHRRQAAPGSGRR